MFWRIDRQSAWRRNLHKQHKFCFWQRIIGPQNNLWWRGPQEVSNPTSCSKWGHHWGQTRFLRALSSQGLKTCKGGDYRTFLGNLHLHVIVHIGNNFFLICSLNLSFFILYLLYLIHLPGTSVMNLISIFSLTHLLSDPPTAFSSPSLTTQFPQFLFMGHMLQHPAILVALCHQIYKNIFKWPLPRWESFQRPCSLWFFLMEGCIILPTDDIAVNNSKTITTSSCICLKASHLCILRSSLTPQPFLIFLEIPSLRL